VVTTVVSPDVMNRKSQYPCAFQSIMWMSPPRQIGIRSCPKQHIAEGTTGTLGNDYREQTSIAHSIATGIPPLVAVTQHQL